MTDFNTWDCFELRTKFQISDRHLALSSYNKKNYTDSHKRVDVFTNQTAID